MQRNIPTSRRLDREQRTILIMIEIYCKASHPSAHQRTDYAPEGQGPHRAILCLECGSLYDYAAHRVERCRFGDKKPVCAKCPVHCYTPEMRAKIRSVMRLAGPRMLFSHPWLAILHALDSARRVPPARHSSV